MTSARIICRGEVPESTKDLARGREVFGRATFGDRAVVNEASVPCLRPSGFRPSRSRIHLAVNDALVGEVLAERHRRDRIDPCWRENLIGVAL